VTAQARPPLTSGEERMASAEISEPGPDPVAISPAIGPLPAIYVPRRGEAGGTGVLFRATAWSAHRACGWDTRHLRSPRLPRPGR
jgi:hypothetical protein